MPSYAVSPYRFLQKDRSSSPQPQKEREKGVGSDKKNQEEMRSNKQLLTRTTINISAGVLSGGASKMNCKETVLSISCQ